MYAMVLEHPGAPLQYRERPTPVPGPGEVRVAVEACAVCRTDLHVVDGDLPFPGHPVIPGHEIVGRIIETGPGVEALTVGQRVGIPWLGHTCGHCEFCLNGMENLCDQPLFTGYTRDGGFATEVVADARYAFPLDPTADPVANSPLLCAGLIGWRCLRKAGKARRIGLYGFGAAAHILTQICCFQGREVFAFTRQGDGEAQDFARQLGAVWAGSSDETPPVPLDAAILFAPVGELVPLALRAVRKGGTVVCGGIHMSEIPPLPYALLWEERQLVSVANLTREDACEFFPAAARAGVKTHTRTFPLQLANEALDALRSGQVNGAAVLVP
ncbi:zinc-dependent alcohol dehydrogenase family protein [Parahaliea maris]|uniref:alcohol dehydrogenase n=1 Tax=Parahaliea maris TaxID=2716870 RepID=A0A5C9A4R4_9GAMM|nr:zinc-dependent alcohol dehydrogenase family protein [Parahaliea maris]TXS95716.1 zinc-dependent alcohol dehydrogenase family protein [Parahaliea maris]